MKRCRRCWFYLYGIVLVILPAKPIHAQIVLEGKIGLDIQFGTHIRRLGLMYQLYLYNDFAQLTQGGYFHFNGRNLGPQGKYPEMKLQLALQGHWGNGGPANKYFFNEFSNLSGHAYCIGYSICAYLDGKQMSQTAGTVYTTIENFQLAVDNDAFGTNPYDDKYRTGAFLIAYRTDDILWSVQSTLWTGKSIEAPKIRNSGYPARKGYRDPANVQYGKCSHGILAARADYQTEYKQTLRGEIGFDSEMVRNLLQNRLVHNMMPDRWVGYENPHYPMLQEDGSPYLYKPGQKIKKPKPYFQLAANQPAFY